MKIAVLTDIHGDLSRLADASHLLKEADLTVITGDITTHGDMSELKQVVNSLKDCCREIVAIPGNMDGVESISRLKELGVNIHGESRLINGVQFLGSGGSTQTPFGTPFELSEDEIVDTLHKIYDENQDKHIVIVHNPPKKTKLDRVMMGAHVGSQAIREFAETKQPDVLLSGHIHEAVGVDSIGSTLCMNPGPFRRGGVGIVEIDENGEFSARVEMV